MTEPITQVITTAYQWSPDLFMLGILSFAIGMFITGIKFLIWAIHEYKPTHRRD